MQFEEDSVEYAIEQHVRQQLSIAIPHVDGKSVIIVIADGSTDFRKRKYNSICTEILSVTAMISSEKPLNRLPILKSFPRGLVNTGGFNLQQEYRGHKFRNYAEILGTKGTSLEFKYTHDIEED
jgi:hypothetical protein